MQTLYFIAPVCALIFVLWFAVRRIEASSYVHRRVDAPHPSRCRGAEHEAPAQSPAKERLEERYVDWYTSENAERAREIVVRGNVNESLNDDQFNPGGVAYRPSYRYRGNTRA